MTESVYQLCSRPPRRVLIFAKAPEVGRVKTRLAKSIGTEGALEIHRAMIRDLLGRLGSGDELDIDVIWSGSEEVPGASLVETFSPHRLTRQIGSDLGERMATAISDRALLQRTRQIIAIGTDLPDLERIDLEAAFSLLDSCGWVVGPALDGGYYLIGCRSRSFDASVFQGIHWGESSVLEATTERIRKVGESVALLPQRRDIDEIEDLVEYVNRHPDEEVARVYRQLCHTKAE
ncbi:MAG: TIGR04282 family arsenosugar biosynthesis glycosyltransferase [Acidobacteria bacterium]|nr:TIGR04282 family arsenosugar biosynthesis glycosyltransferase [Acidobacteriota bacterium]